jgi:hypothetical protein
VISIFTYEQVRMLDEERRQRSMAQYALRRHRSRADETGSPRQDTTSTEVIELTFGARSRNTEQLGA